MEGRYSIVRPEDVYSLPSTVTSIDTKPGGKGGVWQVSLLDEVKLAGTVTEVPKRQASTLGYVWTKFAPLTKRSSPPASKTLAGNTDDRVTALSKKKSGPSVEKSCQFVLTWIDIKFPLLANGKSGVVTTIDDGDNA